jgi:hypothetical protein
MADLDIHYDPITVNNNPATVTIQGLDNVKDTITLQTPQPLLSETKSEFNFPNPIKTQSNVNLAITQPIRTESKAELDIKPLEFDQCLTIRLAPLPPTSVRQPYQQHFGVTLFGVEWLGFNLEGELQTVVSDLQRPPQVDWGSEQPTRHSPAPPSQVQPQVDAAGLRIRLGK